VCQVLTCAIYSDGTVDYQARQHEIDVVLDPYDGSKKLDFDDAQKTLQLTYKSTVLQTERNDSKTTGLDSLGVRPANAEDPELPIGDSRLSIDAEGLVANADGTCVTFIYTPSFFFRSNSTLGSGSAMNTVPTFTTSLQTASCSLQSSLQMRSCPETKMATSTSPPSKT
jgi:hypothetical protein